MSATTADDTTTTDSRSTDATVAGPAAAFTDVMSTAVEFAATKLSQKASDWTDKLNGIAAGGIKDAGDEMGELAEGGDAKQQAAAKGVQAGVQGNNPVWAAIKGAWSGAGPKGKAAIVTAAVALVLLLVLSPVLLLVFLITLLIITAVTKARSTPARGR